MNRIYRMFPTNQRGDTRTSSRQRDAGEMWSDEFKMEFSRAPHLGASETRSKKRRAATRLREKLELRLFCRQRRNEVVRNRAAEAGDIIIRGAGIKTAVVAADDVEKVRRIIRRSARVKRAVGIAERRTGDDPIAIGPRGGPPRLRGAGAGPPARPPTGGAVVVADVNGHAAAG